jgi:hypothetical protein
MSVCWDADFRCEDGAWVCIDFEVRPGRKWPHTLRQLYLKNAYRVILTRARQCMIIFVPEGDAGDPTRPRSFLCWDLLILESLRSAEAKKASAATRTHSGLLKTSTDLQTVTGRPLAPSPSIAAASATGATPARLVQSGRSQSAGSINVWCQSWVARTATRPSSMELR